MEDSFNIVQQAIINLYALDKVILIQIVGNIAIADVIELATVAQVVHHDDVGAPHRVQGFNDVAANKTGAACYDNHASVS